ncbi:MAG: DUF790 family protein [Planctomycetales bacterium]
MLARRHAIATCDFASRRIVPDRLTTRAHRRYLDHAGRMLDVYRGGGGATRRELHRAVREVFRDEADCPQRRIDAFCKLLDDKCRYHRCAAGEAAELRRKVFRQSAGLHPLVERPDAFCQNARSAATSVIAQALDRKWTDIEADLFADVIDFHRLEAFDGYENGEALLARYNVAQVQAALFDAVSLTVQAGRDFKTVLCYAKLAGLMHEITREPSGGYRFRFDGPASLLRKTPRYGPAMARFLPALVACGDWRMHAVIERRRGAKLALELSSADGLKSPLPSPAEFDSRIEENFARKWGDGPRDGWTLVREGEVLHRGQKAFVPDFSLRHEDGRRALLEIVGFWTPEYLRAKMETLRSFRDVPILLAVPRANGEPLAGLRGETIVYKSALKVAEVLEKLNGQENQFQ